MGVDISDLPPPPGADISDLPAPPPSDSTDWKQEAAAPFQAVASMGINALAPLGAAAEMLLRGKLSHEDYANIKKKWDYSPSNPAAQDDLQFLGNLPGIKQAGQLAGAGGDAVESLTGGAIKSSEAQDAANVALSLLGAKAGRAAPAADAAADTSKLWKINPADSGLNQTIINRSWAQAIGENATKLTQDVLRRANARIKGVFNAVESPSKQYNIDVDGTISGLGNIVAETTPELANDPTMRRFVDKLQASGGQLNGQELGEFSHRVGEAAKAAEGKYELQQGLFRVQDEIQNLVQQGLSPAERTLYAQARQQYRALHGQLLALTGNMNTMTGDVNAASMSRFLRRTDKNGYAVGNDAQYNTSPAYNAARFGEYKQGSNTALFDQVAHAARMSGVSGMITRAAQKAGVSAQWVAQVGAPAAAKALSRNADFVAAMQEEMNNQRQQEQQ